MALVACRLAGLSALEGHYAKERARAIRAGAGGPLQRGAAAIRGEAV
jgi:hypothetical protein